MRSLRYSDHGRYARSAGGVPKLPGLGGKPTRIRMPEPAEDALTAVGEDPDRRLARVRRWIEATARLPLPAGPGSWLWWTRWLN